MFAPFTSSLRYVLPRVEQRLQDRRSGAYPTKARTGDRTRTGRNKFYFDDTRTVIFQDSVSVSLPTTFRSGTSHLISDLRSNFLVTGNVIPKAVDQWIPHREQLERCGPFIEDSLFEQDEHSVINSSFMTGAAFGIAPDRFKSGMSSKTIIRIEIPLTKVSRLSEMSSSLHYLNPVSGGFVHVTSENSRIASSDQRYPTTFAPLPFTPYGFHFQPVNQHPFSGQRSNMFAERGYKRLTDYSGDGSDPQFFDDFDAATSITQTVTASVLNPAHRANASQSVRLADYISHPFLLEKAVVEFPLEAGPDWLNDRFGYRNPSFSIVDVSGPLITFAMMRQDHNLNAYRDIIATGTFTTALDVITGSYNVATSSAGGFTQITVTPEGIGHLYSPTAVIRGTSSPSGSNNFYTGSVKMTIEPQVTSHVWRMRVSGSAISSQFQQTGGATAAVRNEAVGMAYGPITKRTARNYTTSRNVLGNHLALINPWLLNGTTNPVRAIDQQFENLPTSGTVYKQKVYSDIVAKTAKSPYLLYPEDRIIFALNKHRAVGSPNASDWFRPLPISTSSFWVPNRNASVHDVKIPRGVLKITLYGDLIKEDREFHDTLNQRLETEELWENVGEEPVLDQFDITYSSELSGSYIDRFTVLNNLKYTTGLTASNDTTQYYSNFSGDVNNSNNVWDTSQRNWAKARRVYELQKSCRNAVLTSDEGVFWDCRLLVPDDIIKLTTPGFSLGFWSVPNPGLIMSPPNNIYYGGSIEGWWMSYPYEPKFNTLSTTLDKLTGASYSSNGNAKIYYNYSDLAVYSGGGIGADSYIAGSMVGLKSMSEFIKYFFGIGDHHGPYDNQAVLGRVRNGTVASSDPVWNGADVRGWRYGMLNGFSTKPICVFRRDRFGQFRDMLEQRLDAKFHDGAFVKDSPVQVRFYDQKGMSTTAARTLSSNLSTEATSSMPYTDGVARNRSAIDYGNLNISLVIF